MKTNKYDTPAQPVCVDARLSCAKLSSRPKLQNSIEILTMSLSIFDGCWRAGIIVAIIGGIRWLRGRRGVRRVLAVRWPSINGAAGHRRHKRKSAAYGA